jgi:hypothetical protein
MITKVDKKMVANICVFYDFNIIVEEIKKTAEETRNLTNENEKIEYHFGEYDDNNNFIVDKIFKENEISSLKNEVKIMIVENTDYTKEANLLNNNIINLPKNYKEYFAELKAKYGYTLFVELKKHLIQNKNIKELSSTSQTQPKFMPRNSQEIFVSDTEIQEELKYNVCDEKNNIIETLSEKQIKQEFKEALYLNLPLEFININNHFIDFNKTKEIFEKIGIKIDYINILPTYESAGHRNMKLSDGRTFQIVSKTINIKNPTIKQIFNQQAAYLEFFPEELKDVE